MLSIETFYGFFHYLDDIEVPPEDSKDHFVYHKSNGLVYESSKHVSDEITSYETAEEFCAKKNGTLFNIKSDLTF